MGNRNIVQIACGDQHAMALSRGSLFKNTFLPNRSHACSEKAVLVLLAVVGDTIIE